MDYFFFLFSIATFMYKRMCCKEGDCNKGCKCGTACQEDQVLSETVKIQPEI